MPRRNQRRCRSGWCRCKGRGSWRANFAEEFNAAAKFVAVEFAAIAQWPAFVNSDVEKNAHGDFFVGGELSGHVFKVGAGIEPAPMFIKRDLLRPKNLATPS